ncbi:putative oxidoreductase [Yersinia aldovae]|uniref:GMC oxidoreductase n=1 Tax=Yersinia aldovae TaxID=29483 RepID=UPI0005E57411|nr:GMC oxidoreductase [Yersinia aldovae]CNJ13261.1 putative oxidoreductase [Yersinia aldovae]
MNVLNNNTTKKMSELPSQIHILILGGGMSGLELAKHLDYRDINNIVVMEAGPADDCRHINAGDGYQHADKLWKNEETDKFAYRSWHSLTEPHFSNGSCIRRRLGGRSLYWHGVILPIETEILKEWPVSIARDLEESWLGGPSLYTLVQSEILAWAKKDDESDYSFTLANLNFKIAPQVVKDIDSAGRWEAYSPLSYWKEDNQSHTDTTFIIGYEAIALIIKNGECIGVKVKNTQSNEVFPIFADICVLALGTIENTRLAAQALYDTGYLVEKRLYGLADHIVQGFNVTLEYDKVPEIIIQLMKNKPNTIFYCGSQSGERFNLFFIVSSSDVGIELEAWAMGEQIPSDKGYIALSADDENMPLQLACSFTHIDKILVQQEQYELNDFWQHICLSMGITFSPLTFDDGFTVHARTMSDVYSEFHSPSRMVNYNTPVTWISPLGTENHESSTLPLGGILNDNQEFVHINNLFSVGPSTFPRPGAANPSLTTLALSRRLAYILN